MSVDEDAERNRSGASPVARHSPYAANKSYRVLIYIPHSMSNKRVSIFHAHHNSSARPVTAPRNSGHVKTATVKTPVIDCDGALQGV